MDARVLRSDRGSATRRLGALAVLACAGLTALPAQAARTASFGTPRSIEPRLGAAPAEPGEGPLADPAGALVAAAAPAPGRKAKSPPPGSTRPVQPPVAESAPPPAPALASTGKDDLPPAALLGEARKAYDAMEYEIAAALAGRLLAREGLDTETRLDAYVVQAISLAITSDPAAAEVPFRLLLRARADFALPAGTAPKIMGVFRKVQAEEKAISDQMKSVARKRLVESLQLVGEPPDRARGGRALPFALRLRDPTSAVTAFEVPFRKQGEADYSTLALKRDSDGAWRGSVPAEWTASATDYVLEYYLQSRDDVGPLLARGTSAQPLRLAVAAGSVERAKPVPRWALWTGVALAGAAAVAAGGLGIGELAVQRDYDAYAQRSLTSTIDGSVLQTKAEFGHTLSNAALGAAITAGVLAAVTLAILPFTRSAETTEEP